MALKEMLAQAEQEYSEYVREQARLSQEGTADPEFMTLMTRAANYEDEWWEKFKRKNGGWYRHRGKAKGSLAKVGSLSLPITKPKTKPFTKISEQEKDARLFETGADWLEQNKWVRGWQERVTLADGRTVDARCALGSILATVLSANVDGGPTPESELIIDAALGRVGLDSSSVIQFNDNQATCMSEVARYLRGISYRIREGL